jgi:hypothetical protein
VQQAGVRCISRKLGAIGRREPAAAIELGAVEVEDGLLWFWVGIHEDYERLIAEYRPSHPVSLRTDRV